MLDFILRNTEVRNPIYSKILLVVNESPSEKPGKEKPQTPLKALMSIKSDLGEPDRLGGLQLESKKHLQIAP